MLFQWMVLTLLLTLAGFQTSSAIDCGTYGGKSFLKFEIGAVFPYTCEWNLNRQVGPNKTLLICHPCITSISCTNDDCDLAISSDADCGDKQICGVFSNPGTNCEVDLPGLCHYNQIPRRITTLVKREYETGVLTQGLDCKSKGGNTASKNSLPICGSMQQTTSQPASSTEETGQVPTTPLNNNNNNSVRTYVPIIVLSVILLIVILVAVFYFHRRRMNAQSKPEETGNAVAHMEEKVVVENIIYSSTPVTGQQARSEATMVDNVLYEETR